MFQPVGRLHALDVGLCALLGYWVLRWVVLVPDSIACRPHWQHNERRTPEVFRFFTPDFARPDMLPALGSARSTGLALAPPAEV